MEQQDIWDTNQANKKEYSAHEVFPRLKIFSDFYDQLSFSIPDTPTMGIEFITNMDTFVYSSIHGTLESISLVLKNGRIGDAFALLRKYHDSVIINIYTNLYLEDNRNIENLVIEEIANWLKGVKALPEYRKMSQYIRNSEKLKPITDALYGDDRYKKTRDRCNDNLHYNFFSNVEANDNQVHFINRGDLLSLLKEDVTNIFVLHLGYLFYLHDHYMMSSDYIDALEVGITPEKDSQYWVAPFIQEIFDEIISVERPDISKLIKDNSCMKLSEL